MLRALKWSMVVYAVMGIFVGVMEIFFPNQFARVFGLEEGPTVANANTVEMGFAFIAAFIFLIIAAWNPIKHLVLVKYAIVLAMSLLASVLYSTAAGYYTLGEAWSGIAIHGVFGALFLIFYPWKNPQGVSELTAPA